MKIFNKDFIIDLQKTILWQYDKASKLRSLIDYKQAWYKRNVTDFIANFFVNIFNLKTANDFGLSVWGRILNFPRQIFLNKYQITAEQTVGTDLTDIEVSRVVFNAKIESGDDFTAVTIKEEEFKKFIFTYDGSNWNISGSVTANDVDIADYGITFTGTPATDDTITVICDWTALNLTTEQYRFLLLGQVLKFRMNCTLPEINRYLRLIFNQKDNSNVYVTDNHNMTITYTIRPPVLDSDTQKLVNNYDFLPAPAGVKASTTVSQLYTLTINTTPADATVIFTVDGENYNQHSIDVEYGTVVNWSISKENYMSQAGSQTVTDNIILTKTLEYLGDILYFYGIGDISYTTGRSRDIKYSINGSDWQNWDGSTLTLQSTSRVYIKGNNPEGLNNGYSSDLHFNITGTFVLGGRVTSLLTDSGENLSEIPSSYCFYKLFEGCSGIINVSSLKLSSSILKDYCYSYMFANCSNIISIMRDGLKDVVIFAKKSCSYMFANCSNLTYFNSQIICNSSSILGESCFDNMFSNCTRLDCLVTPPKLLSNNLEYRCYNEMFRDCISMTWAPELPATNLADSCYRLMFYGCTSLSKAPYLPATNLVDSCYSQMFELCSSLNEVKINYTGTFGHYYQGTYISYYTGSWLDRVSSTGIFYYNGSDTTRNKSAIPSGWTVQRF